MSTEYNETTNTTQPPPEGTPPRTVRLLLARLVALLIPGSEACRSLTTEEEIIACMARRHPTMFIT